VEGSGDDHKAYVAGVFGRTAERYDRVGSPLFAPLGRRLVELAEVQPGARVLDVGTGTGAVLLPAAAAAGGDGYVLGIDLSPEMVRLAAAAELPGGAARVDARVMDAEQLDHLPDGEFDTVLCACAISFFPHPDRALAEFHRVLAPGGTIGVSRWHEADPRWDWYPDLLKQFGLEPRRLMTGSPDPETELAKAGFGDLSATAEDFYIAFAGADEWWEWAWAMPHRAVFEAMDERARERFRAGARDALAALEEPGGIRLHAQARYVIGQKRG
jgi:ubiquinone/menaquinone biosynthesis C-methylase UbiE